MIRLGGPIFAECPDPESWAAAARSKGYGAVFCPIGATASDDVVRAYVNAAAAADLVIAEVGAWSNPLSPNDEIREAALAHCKAQLALADRIGARCCVNIAGSLGEQWDGPHPANLTPETFDLIVECVRAIIDAVKPTRSSYSLETMPWMYPDSVESYDALIKAIDRPGFSVHFDPVNLVCSPQRYFTTGDMIRQCFEKLGPHIRSCHAKDILLAPRLTTHLDEVRPGLGALDYRALLECLDSIGGTAPLMLEHLATEPEYDDAAAHIRGVARSAGIAIS